MKRCGLLLGDSLHHLDHLAPLCSLLQIPLIVTATPVFEAARKLYTHLLVEKLDEREATSHVTTHFDTVYTTLPRPIFDTAFFFAEHLQKKRLKSIWCPHGNSDKGRTTEWMEALTGEETLLTYGRRIEEFMLEKGVNGQFIRTGNFRLAYFEKHVKFYSDVLAKWIPDDGRKRILYAPTWKDEEGNSSFPNALEKIKQLKEEFQVLALLHPNLFNQFPYQVDLLKKEVHLLVGFTPIYPLFSKVDLLISDISSSLGYDFLHFRAPMLLLSKYPKDHPNSSLGKVGHACTVEELSLEKAKWALNRGPIHHPLYEETFDVWRKENSLLS